MTTQFTGQDRTEGGSANDRQVGGSHYAGGIQHWDLIELYGVGYLEGCATKYIQRYKLKNGEQDLRKALHYVQKLRELHAAGQRQPRGRVPDEVLRQFAQEHRLHPHADLAVTLLCSWEHDDHLAEAVGQTEQLLATVLAGE